MLKQIKEYFVPGKKNLILFYLLFLISIILPWEMLYEIFWLRLLLILITSLFFIMEFAFRFYLNQNDPLYIHYLYLTRNSIIIILWVINFIIFPFSFEIGLIFSAIILIRHVMYYFNIPQYLLIVMMLSLLSPTHCCYIWFLKGWTYVVRIYGFYHVLRLRID